MIGRFSRLKSYKDLLDFKELLYCLGGGALALASFILEGRPGFPVWLPAVLALASVLHLVFLPVLAAGACSLLGVDPVSRLVVVLFTAVPASASSYILARQMGGDADLMAAVITIQTALSALSLPLAAAWLG